MTHHEIKDDIKSDEGRHNRCREINKHHRKAGPRHAWARQAVAADCLRFLTKHRLNPCMSLQQKTSALKPSQPPFEAGDAARLDTALSAAQTPVPSAEMVRAEWEDAPGAFRRDWKRALAAAPFVAHHQAYDYGEAVMATGGKVLRARLMADGRLIGVAQAVRHMTYPILPAVHVMRGPVWARPDLSREVKIAAAQALHASAPVKGFHAVLITPEEGDGLEGSKFKRIYTGAHTVLLDLTPDEQVIRKGFNGKWRNRLKAAEKEDVTVSRLGRHPKKFAWLLGKDEALMRSIGHRSSNMALVPAYYIAAGKKSVLAFEAKAGAERIGGMLFLIHGQGATYHIGWSNDDGKARSVHNLIMWRAIGELKKLGVATLDLGGVDTDLTPGIARFKLGLGGRVVSTAGSWTRGPKWG